MRRLLGTVLVMMGAALAVAAAAPARAVEGGGEERITLKVGKPMLWSPGYACMMIVCDDPGIVRVEDARTKLRLIGLRPGSTRCGFWRDQGFRRVVSFEVKK